MRISDWSSDVCSSDLHVVTAQAEQDERGPGLCMVEHEGEALAPRRGGVARNARILDPDEPAVGGERGLKLRRQPFPWPEPVAGVEAVAKGDDQRRVGGDGGGVDLCRLLCEIGRAHV